MEKKKILLVDNDPSLRQTIASTLSKAGFDVKEAGSFEQALQLFSQDLPDLVISDILMPNLDGAQFYKKLREMPMGKRIPFIVLSGRPKMRDFFEALGVDDFLEKPFDPAVLEEKVKEMLMRSSGESKWIAKQKRVLVAGVRNEILDQISTQLREGGCRADQVTKGDQVIYKMVMFMPSLLVLDVNLEGIRSSEVIKIIRQMSQFKTIPIVVYASPSSKNKSKEELQREETNAMIISTVCLEAGANAYIGMYDETTFYDKVIRFLRNATIVIVDDDAQVVKMLKTLFEKEEYRVYAVPDGKRGLEIIQTQKPDLVLLDVILPEMNGFDVLQQLKADPATEDIPVVMLTVKNQDKEIQEAINLGAVDYITKPFHMGLVLRRIKTILGKQ